jgi:hypothetical protein
MRLRDHTHSRKADSRAWPAAWIAATILAAAIPTSGTEGSATEQDRADAIRDDARSAMGGAAAVAAVHAIRSHANATAPDGSFGVEVLSHRNGAARATWTGGFTLGIGSDGRGWMSGDAGTEELDTNSESFLRGHELHMLVIAPETRLTDLTFTGRVEFAGEAALRLTGRDHADSPVELYYRAEDSRPLGIRLIDRARPERGGVTTIFSDWRETGGIRLFHGARFEQDDEVFTYAYDVLEALPDLDASHFAPTN